MTPKITYFEVRWAVQDCAERIEIRQAWLYLYPKHFSRRRDAWLWSENCKAIDKDVDCRGVWDTTRKEWVL